MEIGTNIKSFRTEKGLTQKGLADLLFVTAQAVSRWENNEVEPGLDMLQKMSEIFGCAIDDILYGRSRAEKMVPESSDSAVSHPIAKVFRPIESDDGEEMSEKPDEDLNVKEAVSPIRKYAARSYGWGLAAGSLVLIIAIWVAFGVTFKDPGTKWLIFGLSPVISYAIFSLIYCLFDTTYVFNVFAAIFHIGFVKFPGIIFTFDLDGFVFLIALKILFWLLGFLFAFAAFSLAIGVCALLSMFTFPFVANSDGRGP